MTPIKFTLSELAEMVEMIQALANVKFSLELPPPFPDNSYFNLAEYDAFCKRGEL